MRLISARILGYGRLVDASINLDSKVIAIVGPNEAGKTTLLNALAHVSSDSALEAVERSRGSKDITDATQFVEVKFVLDDADRESVVDLDLDEPVAAMTVSRKASGGAVLVGLTPTPRKSVSALSDAVTAIGKKLGHLKIGNHLRPDTVWVDQTSITPRDFEEEATSFLADARARVRGDEIGRDDADLAVEASALAEALGETNAANELSAQLAAMKEWFERPDPSQQTADRLWSRTSRFLLFGEADRTLQSAYSLTEEVRSTPPGGLANLSRMAGLDLVEVARFAETGDIARQDSAVNKANKTLRELFADAWKQSHLSVQFKAEGLLLRVNILENDLDVTPFDERSAGLKMFVALVAFLAVVETSSPPILLIDEAENHLHIDAQADLVGMFMTQEKAAKVIYTTHSPGCLPPDLGVGVRTVVPRKAGEQVSDIKNSFWTAGAGFSPLMLAMGAAAAAFTPARFAVLAEGASEMILLPSLMREVTGRDHLEFQVAPGLSEVPKDFYPQLDLEAAKVVYLVDGDQGGLKLKADLTKGGVPDGRVIVLPAPGIENILPRATYASAVAALLEECNVGLVIPKLPALSESSTTSWAKKYSAWAASNQLKMPSKVAVANWIVEHNEAKVDDSFRVQLVGLHDELLRAFGLQAGSADD
jgi:predicted ATPase